MRARIPWGSLATFAAVIIALAAVSVALTKIGDDGPPLGVCVVTNPYALGTDGGGPYAAVTSVTAPVEHDGVTSCPEGQFVPVQAK